MRLVGGGPVWEVAPAPLPAPTADGPEMATFAKVELRSAGDGGPLGRTVDAARSAP